MSTTDELLSGAEGTAFFFVGVGVKARGSCTSGMMRVINMLLNHGDVGSRLETARIWANYIFKFTWFAISSYSYHFWGGKNGKP